MPSIVWKLAKEVNGRIALCTLCNHEIAFCGNTTNIRRHLCEKHQAAFREVSEKSSWHNEDDNECESEETFTSPCNSMRKHASTPSLPTMTSRSSSLDNYFQQFTYKRKSLDGEPSRILEPSAANVSSEASSTSTTSSINVSLLSMGSDIDSSEGTETGAEFTSPPQTVAGLRKKKKSKTIDQCFGDIQGYSSGGHLYNRTLNALMYMVIADNMPLSTCERKGYKYYASVTTPLFKPPCRTTFTQKIEEKYDVLFPLMKAKLAKCNFMALTMDLWEKTFKKENILGITCHYVENWQLKKVILGVIQFSERHTAENIRLKTEEVLDHWGIPVKKTVAVVTDGAANIVRAAADLTGSSDKQIHCFSHQLNLVIEHVLKKELKNNLNPSAPKVTMKELMFDPIIKICSWFRNSSLGRDQLRKIEDLQIISYCPTRWNSIYAMLERFYALRSSVRVILWEIPEAPDMISIEDCDFIEDVLPILKLINDITETVSSETVVTLSRLKSIIDFMKEEVTDLAMKTNLGKIFQDTTLDELKARAQKIVDNPLIVAATILDPRFKKTHFTGADAVKCSKGVMLISTEMNDSNEPQVDTQKEKGDITQKVTESSTSNDTLQKLADYTTSKAREQVSLMEVDSMSMYLRSPTVPVNSDPLMFWSMKRDSYPRLSAVAEKYLCIPASSTPSERLFSLCSLIVTARRNKLTTERLNKLIFLHSLELEDWHM